MLKKNKLRKLGTAMITALMLVSTLATSAAAANPDGVTSLPDNSSERKVTIHKYAPSADGDLEGDGTEITDGSLNDRTPLGNVEFEIWSVPDNQETSEAPTAAEIAAITTGNTPVIVTTDADGVTSHRFGAGTSKDGKYLIIEKDNPAVATDGKSDPFYLSVPLTNPEGNGWLYDIHVYPKNNVKEGPKVNKDVTEIDKKSDTADMDEDVQWIIRGEIPEDLYYKSTDGKDTDVYAQKYSLTDVLDTALSYVAGSVEVKVADKTGTEKATALTKGADYTLTEPTKTKGGTLKVELTDAGKKRVMELLGTWEAGAEIRVYFKANINNSAILGTEIPNNVVLDYKNSVGKEFAPTDVPEDNRPEVHTGGTSIYKVDGKTNAKLPGAKFKVAREATEAEKTDNTVQKYTITVGGNDLQVVYVDFYNSTTATTRIEEVTTDASGKAIIRGLAYGQYYFVETQAPDGYNLLSEPRPVTIDENSHKDEKVVTVANNKGFTLPKTGGIGTILFTATGIAVLAAAFGLIVVSLKKRKHSA